MSAGGTQFQGRAASRVYTEDELVPVETYREYVIRALPRPEPMEITTADSLGLVLQEWKWMCRPCPSAYQRDTLHTPPFSGLVRCDDSAAHC